MREVLTHRASRAQQRLWFVEQLVPGEPVHNISFEGRYQDRLDAAALRAAVADLVARHESLRTRFVVRDNELWQVVLTPPDEPPLESVDLTGAADPERAYRALCERVGTEAFDLGVAPLLRMVHVRLGDRADALVVVLHHAVADAISADILMRELAVAYDARSAGAAPDWPELEVQYADFTGWQEEQADQPAVRQDLEYWRDQLAEVSTLDLTHGRARPETESRRGRRIDVTVDPDTAAALDEFVRGERATAFMGMLAAYAAALSRVFGGLDIAVSSTVAGRPLPQVQQVIGMFVDRVVLRLDLSGGPTFRELVGQARRVVALAADHASATFDQVVEAIAPEREIGVTPLAQAAINLQPPGAARLATRTMPRMTTGSLIDTGVVAHDLSIDMVAEPQPYTGTVRYRPDVVSDDAAGRVRDLFTRFLRDGLAEPDRPLWTFPAVDDLPAVAPQQADGPPLLHEVISGWAHRTPDAPALVWASGSLDFAGFEAAANQLAHRLRARGVGPEVAVLAGIARSAELMVAFLAILKAGGIYVPVDPAAPRAHLAAVTAQSGASLALTVPGVEPALPSSVAVETVVLDEASADPGPPQVPVRQDNAAYLLFTSGSTGTPKGVPVEHRNAVAYVRALRELSMPHAASHLLVQPPTFDSSMTATLGALANGGALHIVDEDTGRDPAALAEFVAEHPADCMKITSSHLSALLAGVDQKALRPNHAVILGGEAAGAALTTRLLRDGWGVIVHYGPTESTIGVCAGRLSAPAAAPIGRPLPGVGAYLLDSWLQPVPPGCRGELYVGGPQVTRGYLSSASATAAAFVPDPFAEAPGARMYRTGDLARQSPDGTFEYCGRVDRQVKIRGFRVEPGSVEAALAAHPGVRQSVVVAHGPEGARRLVAYVVADEVDPQRLRDFVTTRLPAHAVPSEVVVLAELPVTRNGKLDVSALPDPNAVRRPAEPQPLSEVEKQLLECWQTALPGRGFGVTDDFFDVGGDSILAIHVVTEARRRGLSMTVRQLFRQRTVRAIATVVTPLAERKPVAPLGISGPTVVRVAGARRAELDDAGVRLQWTGDGCDLSVDPAVVPDHAIAAVVERLGATGPAPGEAPGVAVPAPTMTALTEDAHDAYGTTAMDLVIAATMLAMDTPAVAAPGLVRLDAVAGDLAKLIGEVKVAMRTAGRTDATDSTVVGVRVIPLPESAVVTELGGSPDRPVVALAGGRVLVTGPAAPGSAERIRDRLIEVVQHCADAEPVYSAVDFPDADLDDDSMARLLAGLDLDADDDSEVGQ